MGLKTEAVKTAEIVEIQEQEPTISNEVAQVNVENAIENWHKYQELCKQLLDDSDYQKYKDKNGEIKKFPKKSASFKLGKAFNVNTEIIEHIEERKKNGKVYESYYRVRAWVNGRSVEADASCDIFEKGKQDSNGHDLRATAETRATVRAIRKLIGAGEVSSEELSSGELKKIL